MSAELLREAAAKVRKVAGFATAGPWTRYGFRDGAMVEGAGTVFADEHCLRNDAAHVALWHPGIALAVALLLDATIEHVESHDCEAECPPVGCQQVLAATDLARALTEASA